MTPEPSPLCGGCWISGTRPPKNWRNIGLSKPGNWFALPATRRALVLVVILTTLGATRLTTLEKLPVSSGPRLTGCESRFTSTAGFEFELADCAPAANAPAMASVPAAQRAFRRLKSDEFEFMVVIDCWEDAIPSLPLPFWSITEL